MARLTFMLLCAALALMSATVSAKSKDLIVGNNVCGDYLLEQQVLELRALPLVSREKTVTLKGNGVAKISRVEIFDLKGSKNSAEPSIISGGPGFSFVTVNFKSDRGHGINYLIKAYRK